MTLGRPALPIVTLIMASFLLPTAQADRHKQIAAANYHCDLQCLNDGYCSFTKYTDYPRPGDVGYYKSCTCRPGFGGGSCEKIIEECQPPHYKCHNGAPCEIDNSSGRLGCDCSAADAKSELAGYMCRKPVIQSCDTLDEHNKSFCTNGGVCLSSLAASPKHLMFSEPTVHDGCQCADDSFSGPHCEFIKDMPESTLAETAPFTGGTSPGAKAGITLSFFAIVGALIAVLVVRWKRRQQRAYREKMARREKPWAVGGEQFSSFYLDKTADLRDDRDGVGEIANEPDNDGSGNFEEEEDDLQLVSERIDPGDELIIFGAGSEAKFV